MKTKHLFYSLALASAFTACTQEELVNAPVVKDNIADRPVAGVVEFSTEGVESRFNYEKANGFETGDIFGLYLMDQFVDGVTECGSAEHNNANTTYWIYQNHWFKMYAFTNSIQSNYPFRYVSENGKMVWKNDAKLVEGNYFAMFPQNEEALNRRELWHVIDPTVELKKVSSSTSNNQKFQNVENQFWLGYKQIYRDATSSAEGTMKMNLDMTGVLVPLKFIINNNSNNDVIVDKISFKNKLGNALPTLAYVRPAEKNWVVSDYAENEYINCDAKAHYLYNEKKTWTKQTIQNIVEWTVPDEKNIPYGLRGAETEAAYEYSFTYPSNVTLAGNVNGGSLLTTYIAVPAMETEGEWKDLQVSIYGWQKDNSSATGWTYGMLTTTKSSDDDNYTFDLYQKLNAWTEQAEETSYYREVNVKFSEFAWKAVNQSEVATTADMEKMVKSYLAQNSGDVELTIAPDASGVEVTKVFVDMLKKDSQDKGRSITLVFDGCRGGKIEFNDDETMAVNTITTETVDGVVFEYKNGIDLINNAEQTVKNFKINTIVKNSGEGTLTVLSGAEIASVQNEGTMTVGTIGANHGGKVTDVTNYGELTLKCSSVVETLNNTPGAKIVVDANDPTSGDNWDTATVENLKNNKVDNCDGTCVPAELVVMSGKLAVINLVNDAKLTNEATIIVSGELTNKYHSNWQHAGYILTNNGTINGNGAVINKGIISNYGNITAELKNEKTVNAYAGTIGNLNQQRGNVNVYGTAVEVYVVDNTGLGTVTYKDVVAQHVDNHDLITKVYELAADTDFLTLVKNMFQTSSTEISTGKNITFVPVVKANGDKDTQLVNYYKNNIKRITVTGNVVFKNAEDCDWTWNLNNAAVVVNSNKKLSIEGRTTISVKSVAGNVHVANGCVLNGARVDHNDLTGENVTNVTITAGANATENGTAMKDAMAAAEEGDIVKLPAGEFKFGYQFNLGTNGSTTQHSNAVSIVGENGTVIKGETAKVLYFTLSDASKNLTLKNLTIEDEYTGTTGNPNTIWIRPDNCSPNSVVNIVLENVKCKSVMLEAAYVDGVTYNVELIGCEIEKVSAHAFKNAEYTTYNNVKYDAACNVNIEKGGTAPENVTVSMK